ncbi:PREDICTED: (S)-canadine synthase-like [Nelumbo nucifera]|uniref:(S)-canadine synthase-like n=1 Tax=Nelumbo nucifera TaxID=4432 RepID=A0A1U8AVU0_NELNU|nr:PREDICTED: (S)-canadine synthase-like [Nelumbo nucifera]ANY58169.1 CYP719A22 [synthetic construct]WEE66560.1 aporphine methylenedioxy bridge synthase [Nelumbo nucifera]
MQGNQGLILASVIFVVAIVQMMIRKRRTSPTAMKWPAGPRKLPIIGNMHQLSRADGLFHVALTKLAKVHGSVMTIWLGSWRPTIVVSDDEVAWEVLVNKSSDYAARDHPYIDKIMWAGARTIHTSDASPHWHSLRKGLQSGGLGPLSISGQTHLQEKDIAQMLRDMREEASLNGGLVKPFHHIRRTSVRLLCRLCFGPNFEDAKFSEAIDKAIEDIIRISGVGYLADAFFFGRHFPGLKHTFQEACDLKRRVEDLIRPFLRAVPPPNCYLHFLLSNNIPEDVTIFTILEVFTLGIDSTSSTATWALALLTNEQRVQQKLYQDIKKNIDSTQQIVRVEDVSKLQYLQAAVKETLRLKPVAPLVPHMTATETTLMGTKVAQGTRVVVNLHAIHYNPNVWPEPEKYMPERFMPRQEEVDEIRPGTTKLSYFLPFGGGMRACAGMEVGKLHVGFVIANIVNAFQWSSAVEGQPPDLTEDFKFVLLMKNPLTVRITARHP